MNLGEYGLAFVLGTGFDMSANTGLQIVFTRPDGTTLTKTNPAVTIANSAYAQPAPFNFPANTYLNYTFVDGDVNQAGAWSARAHYLAAGVQLISTPASFTVNP